MSDKILKDDPTKTITEKGAFNPKTDITKEKAKNLKAFNLNKTIAKTALKASKIGAIGAAATMVGKKAYDIISEMKKDEKDFPKDPIGPLYKKSMGGETKLSPKQMKIARMAPPPNKITGADFKAMKASNGKMIMARGCKMGKNKPTKLS